MQISIYISPAQLCLGNPYSTQSRGELGKHSISEILEWTMTQPKRRIEKRIQCHWVAKTLWKETKVKCLLKIPSNSKQTHVWANRCKLLGSVLPFFRSALLWSILYIILCQTSLWWGGRQETTNQWPHMSKDEEHIRNTLWAQHPQSAMKYVQLLF